MKLSVSLFCVIMCVVPVAFAGELAPVGLQKQLLGKLDNM